MSDSGKTLIDGIKPRWDIARTLPLCIDWATLGTSDAFKIAAWRMQECPAMLVHAPDWTLLDLVHKLNAPAPVNPSIDPKNYGERLSAPSRFLDQIKRRVFGCLLIPPPAEVQPSIYPFYHCHFIGYSIVDYLLGRDVRKISLSDLIALYSIVSCRTYPDEGVSEFRERCTSEEYIQDTSRDVVILVKLLKIFKIETNFSTEEQNIYAQLLENYDRQLKESEAVVQKWKEQAKGQEEIKRKEEEKKRHRHRKTHGRSA